jgi:hypothetical protein
VTYQIVLPSTEEHPRQHEFIYSEKKRKIIRAGRRGGKTTGVAILAVLEFLKGKAVDYAAPVIEQVGKFWHEAVTALAEPIAFGIYRKLESEKTIESVTQRYCCIFVSNMPYSIFSRPGKGIKLLVFYSLNGRFRPV